MQTELGSVGTFSAFASDFVWSIRGGENSPFGSTYHRNVCRLLRNDLPLEPPSAIIDPAYDKIRTYVEKKIEPEEEWCFDHYDADDLQQVITNQAQVIKLMKEKKKKQN